VTALTGGLERLKNYQIVTQALRAGRPCTMLAAMKSELKAARLHAKTLAGASALAALALVSSLGGCRAPPPTRAELLDKLRHCHDKVTQEEAPAVFVSPCAKLDVTPLNGISRSELAAALGRPTFCMGLSEGGVPKGLDCPPQWDPKWAFFRPPPSAGLGSGPELACETDENQRCGFVHWLSTD
jgi:hypothetical protein